MCLNVRGTLGRIDDDNKNMSLELNTILKKNKNWLYDSGFIAFPQIE